jgi:hypothetical protein
MKRFLFSFFVSVAALSAGAQSESSGFDAPMGFSAQFSIADSAGDLDFGGGLQSPLLFGALAFRLDCYAAWRDGVAGAAGEAWTPYLIGRLGVLGFGGSVAEGIRLYGTGGLLLALPDPSFSTAAFVLGGFGAFGIELFANRSLCYFVELGANGIGALAELMPGSPLYLNGFEARVGLRLYF